LAYLRNQDRYNYLATALAILIVTFSLLWTLLLGGNDHTGFIGLVAYLCTALWGASNCFTTAQHAHHGPIALEPRYQRAWSLIGAGLLSTGIGGTCYGILSLIGGPTAPSLADIFFTLYFPLVFIGLLHMPTTIPFTARTCIDALITPLCFLGISWFFAIGPAYISRLQLTMPPSALLQMLTTLSYPSWNLLSLLLFSIGIIANTWGNLAYAYTLLSDGSYKPGIPYIDPFWQLSNLAIGLSARYQYSALARRCFKEEETQSSPTIPHFSMPALLQDTLPLRSWRYLQSTLVYIPFILLLGLIIYGEVTRTNTATHGASIVAAITGILIATRYTFTAHEHDTLLREREQQRLASERLSFMVTQLAEILDIDLMREKSVILLSRELGFDAAMLLFVENYDHPLDPHPYITVTATSTSTNVATWHFRGDNILYRTFLKREMTPVLWHAHPTTTPPEILSWQQEHRLPSMVFFPLRYHGKMRGCLGVSRRASPMLSQHDEFMLKAYADRVALMIDHVRLYQEAREHETFAKAMANVATRLNAAVVEPAAIGQLICKEGARALAADYTVLYIKGQESKLVPLSVYINEQEATSSLIAPPPASAWPSIHLYEYEAQSLHSLQPTLLYITQQPPLSLRSYPHAEAKQPPTLQIAKDLHRQVSVSSLRDMLAQHAVRTAILAPLIARGKPDGILVFARAQTGRPRDRRPFATLDLSQAQDFGEQAGVAFTNAQLYRSLHTANERLQELDQMKDQFMVTASHELRTPLTAVQGYIELMAEYDKILPPEQRREFLAKARRGCDELAVLLGNVMDASRLEGEVTIKSALMNRILVQEIIDSVILLIEPHLTKEHRKLHMNIASQLAVYADPLRLRQVLMNISTNALKYSPPGTPIGFSARIADPCIIISISDKGKGVQLEEQARIFQRFYRVESDVNSPIRGSGLGLYISHRLIGAMNGKIWVESKGIPGEGSTFHIQLPMAG
jgi:signal transduction histidine kinase